MLFRHVLYQLSYLGNIGAPERTQTSNLLVRSQMLYSIELRKQLLVGVKGIEPNVLLSDGVTVRCLTLRRHSRVLVVLRRIELLSDDYQSPALPLCYRTLIWCLRSGSNEHLRGFNSTLRPHQLLRRYLGPCGRNLTYVITA